MPRPYDKKKRSAPAAAQRAQSEAAKATVATPATAPAQDGDGGVVMNRIGADTAETRHAIMPQLAASSAAWEAMAQTPDDSEAENLALNMAAFLRGIEDRPTRIDAREQMLSDRRTLERATGIASTPADRAAERKLEFARFMDAFAEAECSYRDLARQLRLRAIETDAERILLAEHNYDVRRIQARAIEHYRA